MAGKEKDRNIIIIKKNIPVFINFTSLQLNKDFKKYYY
jgi:hypothetical protein